MTRALQNRLVGTIIVVAIAIIFVPQLLDGEKQNRADIQVNIPVQPETLPIPAMSALDVESITQAVAQEIAENATALDAGGEIDAELLADEAKLTAQTQIKQSDPLSDVGWVVQLGSFQHEKNVNALVKKLRNAGYRAFTRPVVTPNGNLTKVFVGPELDKLRLEAALGHLHELTGLKGRIAPFTVK